MAAQETDNIKLVAENRQEFESMHPLHIQRLIALPYLILGGWCLLAPQMVETLTIAPDYQVRNTTSAVLIGCFGAQAVLGGLFIWFSRWQRTTFLVYALALLPFFWFNYWFVFEVPVFNRWLALDLVANVAMLILSLWGWRAMAEVGLVSAQSNDA